jgi:peptidyl-prolyl cis-trans isomerase SurA
VDEFEAWAQEQTGMLAEDMMARLRENALSQAVLGQEVGSRVVIRREEIEEYYQEHEDEFIRSEGVRLSELLIADEPGKTPEETEKEARDIHERVARGEPFAEMARRYSDSEGSKAAGGDIGIWRRGSLQKEIEDRVFDKNTGHITELIKVQRGWLILKVVERRREGLADLTEVEEEIRNKLIGPRYGPAIRDYLTELREQAYIEIRPGYEDSSAAPNKDTAWSDPANLAPITTTREAVLERSRKRKLLWMIPMGNSALKEEIEREKAEKEAAAADVTEEN